MAIFDPPQNQHPLIDHQNIWYRWLRRLPLRLCQIWWKSVHGGFWANYCWNITKFLFILLFIPFFMNSPTDQTRRRIFTLDGSNDADSRKDALLGVSLTLLPILGVKSPENPNFWGVNRRFRAQTSKILKVSCYRNYCINLNQILHNDRDHQVVVVGGPNRRPTNPRWRTAAILKRNC